MFLTRSEYDRGVNTFSPEGRLFQVEYAIEAIKLGTIILSPHWMNVRGLGPFSFLIITNSNIANIANIANAASATRQVSHDTNHNPTQRITGSTAIAVRTNQGVVLAVEKRVTSPLLEPSSIEKVAEVDTHVGVAMSGLTADARTLIDHARVESQQHRFTYNEPMPVESITQSLCDLALQFGEDDDGGGGGMSRPFGVALLVAGCDEEHGPVLFHTDPSGTFVQYKAKAIGSGSEGAQTALQEAYREDMSMEEAEVLALRTLKQVMEEKVTGVNVDIARVSSESGWHMYSGAEVEAVIARLSS